MNNVKIVNMQYHCREAKCKLSSPLKEPQGSHEVPDKGQFALAVVFPMSGESRFHRFVDMIVFYF